MFYLIDSFVLIGKGISWLVFFLICFLKYFVLKGYRSQGNQGKVREFLHQTWLATLFLDFEKHNSEDICGLWTGVRSGLLISMLGKLNWFHLTGLIIMVLLI